MLLTPLALLTALTTLVSADIQFTSPKAGSTIAGGTAVTIEWKDSGDGIAIADLTAYDLFLCAGGNDASTIIQLPVQLSAAGSTFVVTGNKASGPIGLTVGASTPKNAYFFKMISTATKGGTITNYSPRFSLSGMTGTFPQAVLDGMKNVEGTDGPPSQDNTNAGAVNPADGDYGVEYTMQTGATRYAPMQPVPPTKITKKQATQRFPTSSVVLATTFLPIPKAQTTITKPQTFSVSSRENTAAPAPMPTDDMAKFLARWKD
ncbi:hypothetical protein BU24DRAFT_418844 [Aaosphaeria arxii CBS 175.79]|uniref:Uncharacterized protein n=1 Tax=Aaosphaeria arxii CBS 175.79 TaxID=1450172 RepID=A0A6A5Y2I8_9PLEO|nr:uncharacterized protein BU24DRAFT_418844 [Aaosphaeria arxii CBS 175.79]KAF2019257.1 hypothetical protein BU24DRAFT_418844 [Aaosphaeria arxii CBS 175.79]